MKRAVTIEAELVTGLGEAAGFTSLDWARSAFRDAVGIDPYPGTVNLVPRSQAARADWDAVRAGPGIALPSPRADWCDARLYRARIGGQIDAAIVVPEIDSYPTDQIELIAEVGVRSALGLTDGDLVSIEVFPA
ncbi:MAG: DUF120 domain-containing protein [Alphaproteobacteria bacterium]